MSINGKLIAGLSGTVFLAACGLMDEGNEGDVCAKVDGQIVLLSPVLGEDSQYQLTGIRMGEIKEDISDEDMTVGNFVNENAEPQEIGGSYFFQLDRDREECTFGSTSGESFRSVPYVDGAYASDVENRVDLTVNYDM